MRAGYEYMPPQAKVARKSLLERMESELLPIDIGYIIKNTGAFKGEHNLGIFATGDGIPKDVAILEYGGLRLPKSEQSSKQATGNSKKNWCKSIPGTDMVIDATILRPLLVFDNKTQRYVVADPGNVLREYSIAPWAGLVNHGQPPNTKKVWAFTHHRLDTLMRCFYVSTVAIPPYEEVFTDYNCPRLKAAMVEEQALTTRTARPRRH